MVPTRPLVVRCIVSIVCLGALVLACGCSKSIGKVSGTVTLDGQPLKGGGTVTFESGSGGVSGIITAKGTYTVSRAPVGEVKITLTPITAFGTGADKRPTSSPEPALKQKEDIEAGIKSPRRLAPQPKKNIPEKYTNPTTSGLTYTVKPGEQTFDIPLSSR